MRLPLLRRHWSVMAVAAIALLLLGYVGMRTVLAAHAVPIALATCGQTLPLWPEELPGHFWEQHRHRLGGAEAVGVPQDRLLVLNGRTGQAFRWEYIGGSGGKLGVPTRYTLVVNRRWRHDPWRLCILDLDAVAQSVSSVRLRPTLAL